MPKAQLDPSKDAPLNQHIIKSLCHKEYQSRKNAAVELEALVKALPPDQKSKKIAQIITFLDQRLLKSTRPNHRKGALLGLASISIHLGSSLTHFINEIVPPVVKALLDPDVRVRYYATEAIYNISKSGRALILTWFPDIFRSLARVSCSFIFHI